MSVKLSVQDAYQIGRAEADSALADDLWVKMAENGMEWARINYPASAELDYRAEVVRLERERLAGKLDLVRFPECRGLADAVTAQHRGFRERCGDEWMTAHYYNWYWFVSRRLNTRHVGVQAPNGHCTSIWFSDGTEGPLCGKNLDDIRRSFERFEPPESGPDGKPIGSIQQVGGVSSAVLCDEEPEQVFPVNLDWVRPPEIQRLPEFVEFMRRYREFWGPGNSLWVDPELNSVAMEKSNCRLGVRQAENGASAVTACAYLTPEMNAFKKERDQVSFERRGWEADNADAAYWSGCEARYRRLLKLVDEEARRGPSLEGLTGILLDHAVPCPDRICLAGERDHPDQPMTNWTLMSWGSVLFGQTRRTLWARVEGDTPVYETTPFLIPGPGVEVRPEWRTAAAQGTWRLGGS